MARVKPTLTPSMVKILAHHASGLTLKEVARKIFVSYSAVTNTLYDARIRTGTKTNTQLTILAHDLGYLSKPTGPDAMVFVTQPSDLA